MKYKQFTRSKTVIFQNFCNLYIVVGNFVYSLIVAKFKDKKCIPCNTVTKHLNDDEINNYLKTTPGWKVVKNKIIKKEFSYNNFVEAMEFVNKVANLAEEEGHHPDILLHNWNKVTLTLSTHFIKGLSTNDFAMVSKIDIIK